MVIFGINFRQRGIYSLKSFLQNFAWVREPQDRTRMPNFTIVALKCGRTAPKTAKNGNFW